MENGRLVSEGEAAGAPVTVYLARRIARERKLSGGISPKRLAVAPEVYELVVHWARMRNRFKMLVEGTSRTPEPEEPEYVLFDGVEIYPSDDARMPWRIDRSRLIRP